MKTGIIQIMTEPELRKAKVLVEDELHAAWWSMVTLWTVFNFFAAMTACAILFEKLLFPICRIILTLLFAGLTILYLRMAIRETRTVRVLTGMLVG